ncbi:PREDICTED: probable phosphopantothenoylcysteine decarboxylase [Camelina sativa]|uniref:phosphopantothenoylcysteine decarboxylase n=1 Tax=Camelina sativa TaxID=90675 RepID=A0ABM0X5D7_CAMSA|nr:PREDICTED: probable phosphopantothenoylcysteine decarboxylase [Camelina sativa]
MIPKLTYTRKYSKTSTKFIYRKSNSFSFFFSNTPSPSELSTSARFISAGITSPSLPPSPTLHLDTESIRRVSCFARDGEVETDKYARGDVTRKTRILLATNGSVAAIKFINLCYCFWEWDEVKVVASQSSLNFVDKPSLPQNMTLYTNEHEWSSWNKIGDHCFLSTNTLCKIVGGLCDNLLTCLVRAWDYSKPLFVANAMNTLIWNNPLTEHHLVLLDELGITLISLYRLS